jgi:drug/metabolite transporter (DMT)-like permease
LIDNVSNISIPLTTVAFFAKYGEKITRWDLLGSLIILFSNIFLVIGTYRETKDRDYNGDGTVDSH